jgi:hypothetical protein
MAILSRRLSIINLRLGGYWRKRMIDAIAMWKPFILIAAATCLVAPVTSAHAQSVSQPPGWIKIPTNTPGDVYISNNISRDAKQRNLVRYAVLVVMPQPDNHNMQSIVIQFRGWCKPPGANKLVNISVFDPGGQPLSSINPSVLKSNNFAIFEDLKSETPGYLLWKSVCEMSNR